MISPMECTCLAGCCGVWPGHNLTQWPFGTPWGLRIRKSCTFPRQPAVCFIFWMLWVVGQTAFPFLFWLIESLQPLPSLLVWHLIALISSLKYRVVLATGASKQWGLLRTRRTAGQDPKTLTSPLWTSISLDGSGDSKPPSEWPWG